MLTLAFGLTCYLLAKEGALGGGFGPVFLFAMLMDVLIVACLADRK